MNYDSPLPWQEPRARAAAMYCSDGRFGEHFDDFLVEHLKLPFYDRIALPGGCACIAGHDAANVRGEGVAKDLDFLIQAHELERVVLIQHYGCAFYSKALELPPGLIEGQQRMDLQQAARHIRNASGIEKVEGWFLRLDGETVSFEKVPLV